jgi:flagellar biosynthetic protein FliP
MINNMFSSSFIVKFGLLITLSIIFSGSAIAEQGIQAITVTTSDEGNQEYSMTLQALFIMTALSLIPAFIMMMTSFTRIIVVLSILRQAIGLQQSPSNQILIGISLFLSMFIMAPVFEEININALQPYLSEEMTSKEAFDIAKEPMRAFMLSQTRVKDLETFVQIGGYEGLYDDPADVSLTVLIPAFVTSELKTAFQIGFMLFIPFLVLDLVVASILMAMGMMMLSPMIVSLPFKLMLFVLVDGWNLIMGTLATSFGMGA